jgi:hypothetical protein
MSAEVDVTGLILTVAMWAMAGTVFGAFVLFYNKIPIIPRKYWTVEIYRNSGDKDVLSRKTKGWFLKDGGVQKFRVLMRGFIETWRGVNLDRSIIKTMGENEILQIIEVIPDVMEPSNYLPKNPILTQKEQFIEDVSGLVNSEGKEQFRLKLIELFDKHSNISDLNESRWLSDNVAIKRAQRNRVAGDAWLEKFLPFIALIAVGFFMYLAYDSLGKSFNNALTGYQATTAYYTQQVVASCGGKFIPLNSTQSEPPPKTGGIPFIS